MSDASNAKQTAQFKRNVLLLLGTLVLVVAAAAITIILMMTSASNDAARRADIANCDANYPMTSQHYWVCVERAHQ